MSDLKKAPTHLWVVGVVSVLWNAFGAFDYLMTQTGNEAYMGNFTAEQRLYFESFPAWLVALWALGVWGALAGSILLLMRSRHAVTAFAVSLFGLAGSTLYQFLVTDAPDSLNTPGLLVMNLVIWTVAIALLLYARAMRAKGILR
jgi:hypothetical protein